MRGLTSALSHASSRARGEGALEERGGPAAGFNDPSVLSILRLGAVGHACLWIHGFTDYVTCFQTSLSLNGQRFLLKKL